MTRRRSPTRGAPEPSSSAPQLISAPDAAVGVTVTIENLGRAGDYGALAHYADTAYYDHTYGSRREDVAFYVRIARELGGPVLEYGAGTGRISLPLARAGLEVTGVDLSRPMLNRLDARLEREPRQVRPRVSTVHGDMREVRLDRRFPLVIAPFNALLHLYTWQEATSFLERVREHLTPDGSFVFDVSVPHGEDLCRDPERRYAAPNLKHPDTGQLLRYAERFEYDRLRQLLLVWMEFTPEDGSEPWSVPLTHRQWFPQEIDLLLAQAGFAARDYEGDFGGAPPDRHVDSLVVRARLGRD